MAADGSDAQGSVVETVQRGDSEALSMALESGADPNEKDRWGTPALGLAAGRGDLEVVRLLLAGGGDANLASAVGNTPLMIAAARGRKEAVQALLEAGADPSASNDWGLTAADWAKWAPDSADMRALVTGE